MKYQGTHWYLYIGRNGFIITLRLLVNENGKRKKFERKADIRSL